MRRKQQQVWFLVVPGAEALDVAGPWEVFAHTNDVLGHSAYSLKLMGPSAQEVSTRHGLVLSGVEKLPATPAVFPEIVVVAGGSPEQPMPEPELALARWLRRNKSKLRTVVAICTGAFVLGAAGLLDRRRTTTHWRFVDDLQTRFPNAKVVDEGIFVRQGNVWTSAGITAGVDLALALVEAEHGHRTAMHVAKQLVLFLRRSGNQAQYSSALQRQECTSPQAHDLTSFVLEHVSEPLPVERLARVMAMSVRSLSRWCRSELRESPAEFVRRLRIEEARRLLEATHLPLKELALRTGLRDISTLWRTFVQHTGVSPAVYRERFGLERQAATLWEEDEAASKPHGRAN